MGTDDVRAALAQFLKQQGETCLDDDLVVKSVTTEAGQTFYVVIAMNGCEHAVRQALSPLVADNVTGVGGVWVLRQKDAWDLMDCARRSRAAA